jgi:hypothetical protein
MSDLTFRGKQESPQEAPVEVKDKVVVSVVNDVPVPYTGYEMEHGQPLVVDHYNLGNLWDRTFNNEVSTIESYLKSQVEAKEIENSIDSIKKHLKSIEKVTNMDKEDRMVVKLEVMAEYMKFMMKKNDIKHMVTRYAGN